MTDDDTLESLRYPLGRFEAPDTPDAGRIAGWIGQIAALPAALRALVEGLDARQLEVPYREGGWNARQVVHHLADSHLNSFVRFKCALTEDLPIIKPYDEQAWARLPDSRDVPVGVSLDLLDALHARWCGLLRGLGPDELCREFEHPESGRIRLDGNIGLYAWHGRHHLEHIRALAVRQGWAPN